MRDPLLAEAVPAAATVRDLRRSASLVAGGVIAAILALTAIGSFVWTPYSPTAIDIAHKLQPPGFPHLLGTDALGRDVLSMIMVGARNSIGISVVAVVVGLGFGVPLGLVAASRRGFVDDIVMRTTDVAFAFPALLTAVIITTVFGPRAVNAMVAIGIFNIPVFARVTRGSALVVWQREFVLAARSLGRSALGITLRHILPNVGAILIVQATIQFALAIIAESGLSYVGLGTQPPQPSWGKMLNDAQTFIYAAPHLAIFPGLAITLAVLGLNLLGDGLRDLLDPRIRRVR